MADSDCCVFMGSNMAENHPVAFRWPMKAKLNGAKLIHVDPRFTRIWALHGSGGSYAPLEASMRRTIGFAPLRAVAATIANVLISGPRLAPEKWAAGISPRPFVMVNATDDERLPRESVEALYEGAAEPKEIIWMSGRHIHADAETIQRLVGIVMARVVATDRTAD